MQIKEKLSIIKNQIYGKNVKLIVITKVRSIKEIFEVYNSGEKSIGENKVQELISKVNSLPEDIDWHFVGHLQRNKVKYIAPFISMIHSVDSIRLLNEINKQALKNKRTIDCLLEFHIASESSKYGLDILTASHLIEDSSFKKMENIRICGVMGMATFTDNKDQVRHEFKNLKSIFDKLKSVYFSDKKYFKEISMGMSDDYLIAIEEGSTMIRLGTNIFGPRELM